MRPRASNAPATDLDLRIKASAALACDLGTRVRGSSPTVNSSTTRPGRLLDLAPSAGTDRPWLRPILYVAFALAIAIPWVLLLTDQLLG